MAEPSRYDDDCRGEQQSVISLPKERIQRTALATAHTLKKKSNTAPGNLTGDLTGYSGIQDPLVGRSERLTTRQPPGTMSCDAGYTPVHTVYTVLYAIALTLAVIYVFAHVHVCNGTKTLERD